jgi:hypothetical protein
MTLPRIAPEKVVHLSIAAIESLAVMRLGDRLFVPERECHATGFGIAAMAARSLALGAGGYSRRLSTQQAIALRQRYDLGGRNHGVRFAERRLGYKIRQVGVAQRRRPHKFRLG